MRVATWNPTAFDQAISAGITMEVLEQAGERVASLARQLCPVAPGPRGGSLRASIRVRKSNRPDRKNVRVYAGSMKYRYAPYVEFGSAKIQAYHFMLNALHGANLLSFFKG